MRRDKILKIACNHAISREMSLKPMQTSETTWCWNALDFAENEARMEQLAMKFKVSFDCVLLKIAFQVTAKFVDCVSYKNLTTMTNDTWFTNKSTSVQTMLTLPSS